jgi:UrcA family protein
MTIQENLVKWSLASGVSLALLVGMGTAAMAQDATVFGDRLSDDILTERVSYADLNLASAIGERTLDRRVSKAVRRVCDPEKEFVRTAMCTSAAWKSARPQIDLAVARATEMAVNGTSSIPAVAIVIAAPR